MRSGILDPWRQPDVRRLWTAATSTAVGLEISQLALPTLALLVLHANPLLVSLLIALPYWAYLLIGLPAGALIDRYPRRQIMIAVLAMRIPVAGLVPVMWMGGELQLWMLVVVAALLGLSTVVNQIAERSFLPELVEPSELPPANAQLTLGLGAAQVVGPSIAGGLIQAAGAPLALVAEMVTSLVAVCSVSRIHVQRQPTHAALPLRQSLPLAVRDGLHFVLGHPLLRGILAINVIGNLGTGMVDGVALIYLYNELGLSPGIVGVAMAVGGAGFLVAAIATATLTERLPMGGTLAITSIVYACAPAALALGGFGWPLAAVVLWRLLYGLALPPYDVMTATIRQASTPDLLQGRAISVINTFGWGALGVGPLLGGFLGQRLGLLPAIAIGTVICFCGAVPAFLPALRQLRDPSQLARQGVPQSSM